MLHLIYSFLHTRFLFILFASCISIKLHLQSTNESLDKISMDVIEVTKSLEFTQSTLDGELGTVKMILRN